MKMQNQNLPKKKSWFSSNVINENHVENKSENFNRNRRKKVDENVARKV